jgi:hypothetical protein
VAELVQAPSKEREADVTLEGATRTEAELAATAARLTTPDCLKALVLLERDIERTEARGFATSCAGPASTRGSSS